MGNSVTRVLAAGLALGLAAPAFAPSAVAEPRPAQHQDIIGTWELVSLEVDTDGTIVKPYGERPAGLMIQSATHAQLTIVGEDRPAPPAGPLSEAEAARMMKTMGNWGGRYEFDAEPGPDGTKVTYRLTIAVNQALVGTERVFFDKIEDKLLYVTSRSQPNLQDGRVSVTRVVWRRID